MWPTNSTGLSFAGVLKWLLMVLSLPSFVGAYRGIVGQRVAINKSTLVTGTEAVRHGLFNLLVAACFLAASWAVWYFWQRNED